MPGKMWLLVGVLAAILLAGCGGGDGEGGGGGGDIDQEATQVEQLINRLKGLPDTATTDEQFRQQLAQIRTQVQQAIDDVNDADADEAQESPKNKLASRLQSLRTQLGRLAGTADEDPEAARRAIGSLLSIGEIEDAIEQVRAAGGSG